MTKDHHVDNLQALCKCCHSVKTKAFMRNKKNIKTKYVAQVAPVDVYKQFLDECTEYKKGSRVKTNKLYSVFKIWWENNNLTKPVGRNKFLKGIGKYVNIKQFRFGSNTATNGIENISFTQ